MSGARSYHAGLAAENTVANHYLSFGAVVLERRWRGAAGEIDLVLLFGETVIFVEVKTSATLDRALSALSLRQLGRLTEAAAEYLAQRPGGQDSPARFDLAAVDGVGRVEVVENITA